MNVQFHFLEFSSTSNFSVLGFMTLDDEVVFEYPTVFIQKYVNEIAIRQFEFRDRAIYLI